ncbi:6-phosphogluconolactonase [Leptospira sp. 201903070]|uniref:6-phosphogluconolactonase n=1 Tax=Leptospira ainlahdjerensis TaxID=2810033 RepID=A0ABS2UAB4_9LEPT|nr:6-phosphogluconolactonase [Leptospira ainlahdjerensis]MBM9577311.1 6-phosphogluconolactonase [Leptospira ainlahdjerensis]
MQFREFSDELDFYKYCVQKIKEVSETKIRAHNEFRIVLTGGETARLVYAELRELKTDWSKWFFYFGDERCVPETDPDSNYFLAEKSLFEYIPVSKSQIFRIQGELGAENGAIEYSKLINSVASFDLVLLGLGEDGHVASLFPGQNLSDPKGILAISNSPKPPMERISLSIDRINSSDFVLIIAKGKKKTVIIDRIKSGEVLPATSLAPRKSLELCYYLN